VAVYPAADVLQCDYKDVARPQMCISWPQTLTWPPCWRSLPTCRLHAISSVPVWPSTGRY